MSHVQFTDELVREYLLFRGFTGALKAFDADLKIDKDKGFRVDKIVDQLLQHIYSYDLVGLREMWNHFDTRLFSRLEQHFAPSVRKLENAVLKFYLVNASENNKQDKITEFFNKLTNELTSQIEWKDWFVLPFIKNPGEHAVFSVYFTRQWQDTLVVSLHNFLAVVYQCMPQPTLASFALASFEENATKMMALQRENNILRKGLVKLMNDQEKLIGSEPTPIQGFEGIMDDFFNISQEIKESESQARILKTIMRNISSMPPSPKLENKEQVMRNSHRKNSVKKEPQAKRSLSIDARPTLLKPRERDSSLDLTTGRSHRETPSSKSEKNVGEDFLFLSRVEYNEHKSHIVCIKLSDQKNLVASADIGGNLKVWTTSPHPKTISSFSSENKITCLDWLPKGKKFIIFGESNGLISLYDSMECRVCWSLNMKDEYSSAAKRVDDIVSNPVDESVVAVVSGKVFVIDLEMRNIRKCLNVPDEGTCVRVTRDGKFALVGTKFGAIFVMDILRNVEVETHQPFGCAIHQLEINSDYSFTFALASNKSLEVKLLKFQIHGRRKWTDTFIFDEVKTLPELHGRLFCIDPTGALVLAARVNSGVIFKLSESNVYKCLELGGHKATLTCVDWSFANQCATCVTASLDGEIKISTLLLV